MAVALVIESGRRGFFPFDQSIVFDGGYRILRGQVPYRDFLLPFGPVAFLVQACFFALFGVSYSVYLAHAAVLNAGAALLSERCVRGLFPGAVVPAAAAGLVTAAWFYPLFGTPVSDQTAFFFHLAALGALLAGIVASARSGARVATTLAGALSMVAFLSKQNAGAISIACLAGIIVVAAAGKRAALLGHFLVGMFACAALFGTWLFACSDPRAFARHVLEIPAAEGLRRATSERFRQGLTVDMRSQGLVLGLVLAGPIASALALVVDLARRLARRPAYCSPRARVAFAAAASLGALQWLFIRVTSNLPDNAFGLCGLADVLALLGWSDARFGQRRALVEAALAIGLAVPLVQQGHDLARTRAVHDFWFEIHFRNAPVSSALAPVRWATERDDPRAIRVRDVDELTDFLREARASFFVFPDFTVLYGIAGAEPPQPLVWFHGGLTYSNDYDKALDERIVAELERHALRYVVLETVTFLGTERRLRQFPLLEAYLSARFRETRRFGIFAVRERIS